METRSKTKEIRKAISESKEGIIFFFIIKLIKFINHKHKLNFIDYQDNFQDLNPGDFEDDFDIDGDINNTVEKESPSIKKKESKKKRKKFFLSDESEELIVSSNDSKRISMENIDIIIYKKSDSREEIKSDQYKSFLENIQKECNSNIDLLKSDFEELHDIVDKILYAGHLKKWIYQWNKKKLELTITKPNVVKRSIQMKIYKIILSINNCFKKLYQFCDKGGFEIDIKTDPMLKFINQLSLMECEIFSETILDSNPKNDKILSLEHKLLRYSLNVSNHNFI